jgi:hypothetical protein
MLEILSMKILLIIGICLASVPAYAFAETAKFLKDYDAAANKTPWLEYLSGFEDGFGWANAVLNQQHDRQIYCVPETLTLTADQVLQILRDEFKKAPNLAKSPVGLTIFYGLKETFPCQDSK